MRWRPENETPEDVQRELAAARKVEQWMGARHLKLSPMLYSVDWAFFRDGYLVSWGEYKHRDKRYSTLLLSAAKWIAGRDLANATGRPFFLYVEWPDGLFYYETNDLWLPIGLAGSNRGQNGDKEPCVFIETKVFCLIPQPAKEKGDGLRPPHEC